MHVSDKDRSTLEIIGAVFLVIAITVAVVLALFLVFGDDDTAPAQTVTVTPPPQIVTVPSTAPPATPSPCNKWPLPPQCIPPGYTIIAPDGSSYGSGPVPVPPTTTTTG